MSTHHWSLGRWAAEIAVCVALVVCGAAVGIAYAQQRPGEPPEPIVVEAPHDIEPSTFQVGPIDAIDCGPTDFVVQTTSLRFCIPAGNQGTLVLAGCE